MTTLVQSGLHTRLQQHSSNCSSNNNNREKSDSNCNNHPIEAAKEGNLEFSCGSERVKRSCCANDSAADKIKKFKESTPEGILRVHHHLHSHHRRGKKKGRRILVSSLKQQKENDCCAILSNLITAPKAPFNSTQFLMNDHSDTNQYLDHELCATTSSSANDDRKKRIVVDDDDDAEEDEEDFHSSQDFLSQEFLKDYANIRADRLVNMTKSELIGEYVQMEENIDLLEKQLSRSRSVGVEDRQVVEENLQQSSKNLSDRIRMYQRQINFLETENIELRRENRELKSMEESVTSSCGSSFSYRVKKSSSSSDDSSEDEANEKKEEEEEEEEKEQEKAAELPSDNIDETAHDTGYESGEQHQRRNLLGKQ